MSDFTVRDTGLSVIYEPPAATQIADIIFVHGLQGHPRKTWTWTSRHKDGHPTDQSPSKKSDSGRQFWRTRFNKLRNKTAISSLEATAVSNEIRKSTNDVFWPVDLLSKSSVCSRCRMMTWGYKSAVAAKPGSVVNKNNIFGHAKDLFYSLERSIVEGRPIIFVAHSLGGILVKEVLHLSDSSDEPSLKSIVDSTRAVVFLGTPHRGGGGYANLGQLVRTIASVFMVDTNPAVLDSLGLRSSDLERSQLNFATAWRKHAFKVKTFQESLPLTGINVPGTVLNKTVVPAESSTLGDDREHAETLHADHMGMARYESVADSNFVKVQGELERICLSVASEPDEVNQRLQETAQRQIKDIRQSLAFFEMDRRIQAIDPPLDETCLWLKGTKEYNMWLQGDENDTHHGLLWIKGKPGSGKSTLMKHALGDLHPKESVLSSIRAGFFFNARGSVLDQTPSGLFRSLTYQLLPYFPEQLLPIYERFRLKLNHGQEAPFEWHDEELKSYLLSVLTHRQKTDRKIYLFIDGLDECQGDAARDVVLFFRNMTESASCAGVRLHVCISSQTVLKVSMSPYLEVIVEEHNKEDVVRYIRQKLSIVRTAAENVGKENVVTNLESRIIEKSAGIFLWVVLVTDSLLRTWDTGRAFESLTSELDGIPDQLTSLFKRILKRIEPDTSSRLFQWVAFSRRPLKLSEWVEILPFLYDPTEEGLLAWPSSQYATQDLEQLETRIQSVSCGLVEVRDVEMTHEAPLSIVGDEDSVMAGAGSFSQEKVVQFIHDSVRNFFLHGEGSSILKLTETHIYGYGHIYILNCCLTYTGLPEVIQLTTARLELAQRRRKKSAFLTHPAEKDTAISTLVSWKEKLLSHSSHYHEEFPKRQAQARQTMIYQRDDNASVVSFGSSAGNFTSFRFRRGGTSSKQSTRSDDSPSAERPGLFNFNPEPFLPKTVASWLTFRPRRNSIGAEESEPDLTGCLGWISPLDSVATVPARLMSPAESSLAASTRQLAKLPVLLDYVTSYFDSHAIYAEREGASPESLIFRLLNDRCWKRLYLLRDDIEVGTPLLYYAAENDLCSWIRCVFSEHESPTPESLTGGWFGHASIVAAKHGHSNALSLLLEHDPNLKISDTSGRTLLHHVVSSQKPLLLQTIMNCPRVTRSNLAEAMNLGDYFGITPLFIAAARSSGQMVSLCLESGAKVRAKDKQGHTPLHFALARSLPDMEVCRLLLRAGSNPKNKCVHRVSPLHIAEVRKDEGLLELVIQEVPGVDSWWFSWLSWDEWNTWIITLLEYWGKVLMGILDGLVEGLALFLGCLASIYYWVPRDRQGLLENFCFIFLGVLVLGYFTLGVIALCVDGGKPKGQLVLQTELRL
ncbi:hypothetical protein BP6252_01855 [Coleophoma cylindrospora]|uniref:Nephrocystin 3-like N-terminal domain-containing protein n=1 Tax=Coleophoma cylindrospora TaxID=1849047 RepID=A0A3D8SD43_9HELO|nr:hypothetical protein BP6252_01855 [Coleophoma cylindrospora]